MTRPPLLPGAAPARLLLTLWEAQARGEREYPEQAGKGFKRLAELAYVRVFANLDGDICVSLTEAGRQAAQALEGSS